ncbi:hypothetical protein BN938_0090 [Mucinivorans hirudinis]|nr:hypothetical protein BN938_0090 [Mucinivorans hirudinis]
MREPFSTTQYERIFAEYPREDVLNILLAMENYLPLRSKNKSAYLTAKNWLNRQRQQSAQRQSNFQPSKLGKVDKVLSVLKEIENEQTTNFRGYQGAQMLGADSGTGAE